MGVKAFTTVFEIIEAYISTSNKFADMIESFASQTGMWEHLVQTSGWSNLF